MKFSKCEVKFPKHKHLSIYLLAAYQAFPITVNKALFICIFTWHRGVHPSFYQPCHKNIHNILLSLGFYCICKFLPYRNFSNALIDNLKLRKYTKNFWQMETFQCIVWRGKLCGRKWNYTYCTDPSEQTINIL